MAAEINQIQRHAAADLPFVFSGIFHFKRPFGRNLRFAEGRLKICGDDFGLRVARQFVGKTPIARQSDGVLRGGGVFFQHRHHGRAALFAQGIDAVCIERNPCRQPFVLRVQAAISISHPLVREQIMFDLHQRHTFVFKFDNAVAAPEQGKAARLRLDNIGGLLAAAAPGRFCPQCAGFVLPDLHIRQRLPSAAALPRSHHAGFGAAVDFKRHHGMQRQQIRRGRRQCAARR